MLTTAQARVAALEAELTRLQARLGQIAILAADAAADAPQPARSLRSDRAPGPPTSGTPVASGMERQQAGSAGAEARPSDPGSALHPAARKLLAALAQRAPARFTWGQAATLAGLKAAGGHFNAGRKQLRALGLVEEAADLVAASPTGLDAAGEVPAAPSTPVERLALWCERLPSPAPEMLRGLAAHGGRYTEAADLAAMLGKKPTGGHWNSGLALLRNNGLVEVSGKRLQVSELFR